MGDEGPMGRPGNDGAAGERYVVVLISFFGFVIFRTRDVESSTESETKKDSNKQSTQTGVREE